MIYNFFIYSVNFIKIFLIKTSMTTVKNYNKTFHIYMIYAMYYMVIEYMLH